MICVQSLEKKTFKTVTLQAEVDLGWVWKNLKYFSGKVKRVLSAHLS